MSKSFIVALIFICLLACENRGRAPESPSRAEVQMVSFPELMAALAPTGYMRANVDILYSQQSEDTRLDVMRPDRTGPYSTVVLYHGGGWTRSTPAHVTDTAMGFLTAGFAVVNVKYRLGPNHPAPAAVYDARCALNWVFDHATEYEIDTEREIIAGPSAGGIWR